jgi:hypothetical protein
MVILYDNVINNIPIPNGVSDQKLIDVYLNDEKKYYKYSCLRSLNKINFRYEKLEKNSTGIYPISLYIEHKYTINISFLRALIKLEISDLAYNKIINNEISLVVVVEKEPEDYNPNLDIYTILRENFENFLIHTKNKNEISKEMQKHFKIE